MGVVTAVLVVGATVVLLMMKWWFSVTGRLYRDKSIPVPSGEVYLMFNSLTIHLT